MAKTLISYTFDKGIDDKIDPKISNNLAQLSNAVFQKKGAIEKRNGWNQLGNITTEGYGITTGAALGNFNDELMLFSDQKVYSYATSTNTWVPKGSAVSVSVTQSQVIRNNYSQVNSDNALVNGVRVVAWEDGRGGVRCSIFDDLSGLALLSDYSLNSTASHIKTIACGTMLYIYYVDGSDLIGRSINSANPTEISAAVTLRTDFNATTCYDVCTFSSNMVVAYYSIASSLTIMYVTQNLVVGNPLVGLPNPTVFAGTADVISVNVYNGTYISVISQSTSTGVVADTFQSVLTPYATSTLDSTSDGYLDCFNICQIETDTTYYSNVFYSVVDAYSNVRIIATTYEVDTDIPGTPGVFLRGNTIFSKPYLHDGRVFLPTAFDSTEQSTYFVVRDDLFIIAKIASLIGGGTRSNNLLGEVASEDPNLYTLSVLNKSPLLTEAGSAFTLTGVASILIDHNDQDIFSADQLGQNTMIAGGYLKMYDGESVVEQGFHIYPENITFSTSSSGGSMSDGTYLYRITYEWIDAKGQVHTSAPSSALTVTLSGGGSSQSVELDIPTLKLTQKTDTRVPPTIGVYRTIDQGTVYYKVSPLATPLFNSTTVNSVTFTDTLADSDILSNQLLYTTGGVLENIAPPACTVLQVYKNRMFLGGLENPNQIWYSNKQQVGFGLSFSDFLSIEVDTTGGPITCFSVLDDKLAIFKREAIFILAGNGPTDLGSQNDYTDPQLVNSDAGCIDSNSAVVFPGGVIFKSSKGIYMIDRQTRVTYIGSPVESYNASTVVRSTLVQSKNEVRFLLDSNILLTYNYLFQQWSVFQNYDLGTDAAIYQGKYTFLGSDGLVKQEDSASYLDNTAPVNMKVVTPWFSFAGLQGYQRIYRVFLIGQFKSQHYLRVKFGYDFEQYFGAPSIIDTREFFETNTYGSGDYGDDVFGGSDSQVYQFQFDVEVQKCQSIRMSIEDLYISGSGAGFTITGIALEVSQKSGGNKLDISRKF